MWFSISTLLNCFFVYQIATATLNSLILPDAVPYDGDEALLKAISIAEKELKIFTYSYPESLKSLPHYECMPSSLDMKAEYFIPEYLKKSVVNTNDPNDADLFLINHNFSCLLNYRWQQEIKKYKSRRIFGRDYVGKQYMQPMLRHIQTQYPYFNRSGGSDHLFILAIDAGPYCQHDLPHNLKRFFVNIVNVTFLLNYGFSGPAPKQCTKHHILRQPNKDIVIPQFNYWSPPSKLPLLTNRIIDSFFKGGPNCAFHCKKIRTKLLNIGSIPQLGFIYVSQSPLPLKDSYFALCPAGYAPWSIRLYDAIFSHSIPVILANEIIEPFERFLNWKAFTVKIDTDLISDKNISFIIDMHHAGRNMTQYLNLSIDKRIRNSNSNSNSNVNKNSIVEPYIARKLKLVYEASQWFHWRTDSPRSAWKLILLELWCRTKHSIQHENNICFRRSSSIIGNLSYW